MLEIAPVSLYSSRYVPLWKALLQHDYRLIPNRNAKFESLTCTYTSVQHILYVTSFIYTKLRGIRYIMVNVYYSVYYDNPYICHQCEQSVHHVSQADLGPKWHPSGPSFNFFPYPVIDVTRPWGSDCDSCGSKCTGHYVTDIDNLLELRRNNKAIRSLPPSVIIEEAFKKSTLVTTCSTLGSSPQKEEAITTH